MDAEGSADVGVGWECSGSLESLVYKAVFAIRAGSGKEIEAWLVICGIKGDGEGGSGELRNGGQGEGEEREH